MHIIDFATAPGAVIEQFASVGTTSVHLGDGTGESHVYVVRFASNSQIGQHTTGFGQLFLVVEGSGRGSELDRQGVYFARGELHAKGSDTGMTALMIQMYELKIADGVAQQCT